jgi:hypothetical protein
MRMLSAALFLAFLSGCACMPDRGDSTKTRDYVDQCWAVTKDNKHGQYVRPSDGVK